MKTTHIKKVKPHKSAGPGNGGNGGGTGCEPKV